LQPSFHALAAVATGLFVLMGGDPLPKATLP